MPIEIDPWDGPHAAPEPIDLFRAHFALCPACKSELQPCDEANLLFEADQAARLRDYIARWGEPAKRPWGV